MKKVYTKPDLYCESFALTTSIAQACQNSLHHTEAESSCTLALDEALGLDGQTLFTELQGCTIPKDTFEQYCEWTGDKTIVLMYS